MSTYTYVLMEVSEETFDEIREKLIDAEYWHSFDGAPPHDRENLIIDMRGIALKLEQSEVEHE